MLERGFFNFLNFFQNFLPRAKYERNSRLNFFFLFIGLSPPILAKNNAGKRFFNFWIFLAIFLEFSCSGWVRTEFRTKIFFGIFLPRPSRNGNRGKIIFSLFFSLFFTLSTPVLAKNNSGKRFFNFLIFFSIFFEIFLYGPSMNGIPD